MRSLTPMSSTIGMFVLAACWAVSLAFAQETRPPGCACEQAVVMSNERLGTLIRKIDDDAEGQSGFWRFTVAQRELLVITDENANRMRILTGVIEVKDLEEGRLTRLMQANFDSALDARYAIARGVLWSAFLHPLSTLYEQDFVSGVAQVVNLADTYGSTYSSGAITFGGGDSDELIKELRERENSI